MGASQIAKSLDKPHMLGDGEWIACCPAHKDRTASLSISDTDGGQVLVHCHAGCSQDEVIGKLKRLGAWTVTAKQRAPRRSNAKGTSSRVADIVARVGPITATPAEVYLRSRGLNPDDRACIGHLPGPDGGSLAAMATDQYGEVCAVQLTRLTKDGQKVSTATPRHTHGRLKGSVVVIQDKPTRPVIVTDGVEDAIAIASVAKKSHVVATLGVVNFANVRPHNGHVIFFVDNVNADRKAADRAAAKLTVAGVKVSMARPPDDVKDANDLLIERGPKAIRAALEARVQWTSAISEAQREPSEAEAVDSPEFSDDALALSFAERHGEELRYIATWGRWYAWTGVHWRFEDTLRPFDHARKICREVSVQCFKLPTAKAIASAKTVAAVVSLARTDRRIAATVDQWDANPDFFNTEAMTPGHDGGTTGK